MVFIMENLRASPLLLVEAKPPYDPSVSNKIILSVTGVKHSRLTIDKRLAWANRIKRKRILLNAKRKSQFPLIG